MSEFYLSSISYELIDAFLSNFIHTSILIRPLHILFHQFLTELWPMICVKIVFLFNILGMD